MNRPTRSAVHYCCRTTFDRLLSRDKEIACRAFQVIDRVAQTHRIPGYTFDWKLFDDALYRATAHEDLSVWYRMNARKLVARVRQAAEWEPWIQRLGDDDPSVRFDAHAYLLKNSGDARPALDAARDHPDPEIRVRVRMILSTASASDLDPGDVNSDEWMKDSKYFSTAGYGSDDYLYAEDSPGYEKFQKVKAMGTQAYPYLIRYIDNENVQWGKAAVVCLRLLSGRKDLPLTRNPEQAKQVKRDVSKALGFEE